MGTPVICVTPAGRRHYLDLLKYYVLQDETIKEWHLWDNCRTEEDRLYINELARKHQKISVVQLEGTDGTNRSVNRFYRFCNNRDAFYIKTDDDIVYMPRDLGRRMLNRALDERGKYIWWSPLVINNAICSWLLKYHSKLAIPQSLTCQASDMRGWFDPQFAKQMHNQFLSAIEREDIEKLCIRDFEVSLSRFSINCVGFYGRDVVELGESFCPPDVDDEEWVSAVLPSLVQKPGRIIGSVIVSHFSFYTQEPELLESGLLDRYYRAAGLNPPPYSVRKRPITERLHRRISDVRNFFSTVRPR